MKKTFLSYGAVMLTAITLSCSSVKSQQPGMVLTANTWELSSLNGKDATTSEFSRGLPYINFSTDNKITGNGGCNGFSGLYNASEEGDINISKVMSTKMYCEGVSESEFMQALNTVNITKVEADKLTLMEGVKPVMVFIPKK